MPGDLCPICKTTHAGASTCAGYRRGARDAGAFAAAPTSETEHDIRLPHGQLPGAVVLHDPGPRDIAPDSMAGGTIDAESLILEMVSMRRAPGTMLGSYRLLEPIGEGGMGYVYRAHDAALDRDVAVKLISRDVLQGNAEAVLRFLSEAKLTARIRHRNVVQVHALGADAGGNPYLVMELLEGKTLKDALRAREPFPLPRVVHITSQILSALEIAHEHLVHRDLKPANIFLTDDGGTPDLVKILDFGVAKAASDAGADLTGKNRFVGTPAFIAPEVVAGKCDGKDPRQDLYAVGVLLFLMLTGKSPWASSDPRLIFGSLQAGKGPRKIREVQPSIDPALADIVDRAMALSPDERFQTAADFRAALRSLGEFAPGSLVAETYRIVRKLGEGGMAAVYLVDDVRMERRCALKVLLFSDEDDPQGVVRERFRQDGVLARSVPHPGIVEVYAQGIWRGHPYLVTEYIDGGTLRDLWPRLDWGSLVAIVAEVAGALDAIHGKGIVHRDVTPENILVDAAGHAKLVDFGVARRQGSELTGSHVDFVLGRYGYAAPEQALDATAVDAAADQWSLAATVYEGLTGLPPHRDGDDTGSGVLERYSQRLLGPASPRDARDLNPTVPEQLSSTLARALARSPANRYPTASAFAEALAAAPATGIRLHASLAASATSDEAATRVEDAQAPARGSTDLAWSPHAKRRSTRRTWWLATAGLAVAAAMAVTGTLWVARSRSQAVAPAAKALAPPLAETLAPAAAAPAGASPAPSPGVPEGSSTPAPFALAASSATLVEAAPALARLRIDSRPIGATLVLGELRVPLPTTLERALGTLIPATLVMDGFQPQRVDLAFDRVDGERLVDLVPAIGKSRGRSRPAPGMVPRSRRSRDEIEWHEIYVRPETGTKK